MTQPVDPITAAYADAQRRLHDIYRQAAASPADRRALLAEALAVIDRLDEAARTYAAERIASQFAAGAVSIDPEWRWSDAEVEIAHQLAADSYADLIGANEKVRTATRRLFRDLSGQASDLETRAGQISAAELASERGVARLTYRNGARFPLDAYERMATTTKMSVAFTAGALNAAYAIGAGYIEISDGTGCGWTYHQDPDLADGSIRSLDDYAANPLAHPNCVRQPGAIRLDIRNDQEALDAQAATATQGDQEDVALAGADAPPQRSATTAPGATRAILVGTVAATPIAQRRAARRNARRRRTQR